MVGQRKISGFLRTHSVHALVLLVGLFYVLTIHAGLPWGDDFAMYLMHARNLATGIPYSAIGYVFNPLQPEVGPPVYPPLFPAIIAPAIAVAGLNTTLLKGEVALCFLAALWMIDRCMRRRVPAPYAAAIVAILGFSPYCWQLRDNIVSDMPFLLVLFLTFHRIAEADQQQWKSAGNAVLVGVLIYLCFACRAVGIAVLPSLFAGELIRRRAWPRPGVWISGGVALIGIILQLLLLPGVTKYAHGVGGNGAVLGQHAREYLWSLRHDWFHLGGVIGWAALGMLGLLGLAGYFLAVRRDLSVVEIFAAVYAAMIALWAADQDLRFLLPLIPLWLMYASIAIVRLRGFGFPKISTTLTVAAAVIFLAGDVPYYLHAGYGATPGGTNDPGFIKTAYFVRASLPADATIIFSQPRLLSLVTNRKSSVYPLTAGADGVLRYCHQIGAAYVIAGDRAGDPFENDRRVLDPIIAAHPDRFELIFRTEGFRLYRITSQSGAS